MRYKTVLFAHFYGHLPTFCPFIFEKWAAGNRCDTRLCGFSAHFPTFSLHLNAKKKVKKINKVENKSGLLARAIFGTQNSGKFLRPFSEAVSDTRFVVDGKIAPFQADCGVV